VSDRPPQILAYRPGVKVVIGVGIEAVVTAVTISGEVGKVVYVCEWWDGRDVKTGYFDGFQVESVDEKPAMMRIWFEGA